MFNDSSRYAKLAIVEAKAEGGRSVQAVVLRCLPYVGGVPVTIKGNDRLDVMAQRRYSDPTQFWHLADANTELEANALLSSKDGGNPDVPQTPRTILVPEK
jgi:hypothetical protein